jgi:hypothetical protein
MANEHQLVHPWRFVMFERFKMSEIAGVFTKKKRQLMDIVAPRGVRSDVWLEIRDKDGNLKHQSFQHNLRTNGGADFWNAQLFGAASATAVAKFIGITTDATAAAAGDTTLASEETLAGLGRATGTVSHTASATSSTISATFTYTGSTAKTIAKVGLFNASSAGTLVLETLLSSTGTVNANGDQITITWTVNY